MLRRVLRAARSRRTTVAAALLAAIAGAVPVASASSASAVRVGAPPSIPAGTASLGPVSGSAPLRVTVTLNPRDPQALSAYAAAVATPGSSVYHHYLTATQFAQRFGATAVQIDAVRASLRGHGLDPGPVSTNGLSIPVSATAAQLSSAFSVTLRKLALPSGRTAIAANAAPLLDGHIADAVQSVLGLDTLVAPRPLAIRRAIGTARAHAGPHVATGGPQPCAAARAAAPGQSAYTMDQLASAYGFSGLYGAGDQGAGQTIALFELEPYDSSDIATFQSCYGTHAPVSNVVVDGGAGSGAGSGEAALDIETAIGLAPKANFLVYEGPNSTAGGPGSGFYDTWSAAIIQNKARVISASWGQCEPVEGYSAARPESTLFQEAAVQGQSILNASGDDGSEDCNGSQAVPNPSLAVDDPASQPYVTGVGGTSLRSLGPRPSELVWNNGGNPGALLGLSLGAGGGGISGFWGMPAYQAGAAASLNVVGSSSSGAPCASSGGYCRQVPDVSADADPNTGYLIYWNGSGSAGNAPTGWIGFGGTSAAAPLWGAVIALANASPGCRGSSVGFANPALYRAAAGSYTGDFNDIVSGSNDFTGTNGGKFAAGPGYDLATGLGSPNTTALAAALCPDTIRISNPGTQRSTRGATVGLALHVTDSGGGRLSFEASGLPRGLAINPATGRIGGKLTAAGTYAVRVIAVDSSGATTSTTFSWIIGNPPAVSRPALTGAGAGRPSLAFTIAAGRDGLPIASVALRLPAGMRATAGASNVTVLGNSGRRLRFSAAIRRGVLTITPRSPSPRLRISISYPNLAVSSDLARRIAHHRVRTLTVGLTVTDAAHEAVTLSLRVRA